MFFSRIFTEYGLNGLANEFSDESEKQKKNTTTNKTQRANKKNESGGISMWHAACMHSTVVKSVILRVHTLNFHVHSSILSAHAAGVRSHMYTNS